MSKTLQHDDINSSSSQPDLLPPPSYTEATGSTHSTYTSPSSVPGPAPTPIRTSSESPLTTHLRTLPSRLRSAHHLHSTAQSTRDAFFVSQCVPHIEWFIEDIVNLPKPPQVAELVLVPAEALPGTEASRLDQTSAGRELATRRQQREDKGWELSGAKERRGEGEVVEVGCVSISPEQSAGDGKGRPVDRKVDPNGNGQDSGTGSAIRPVGNYTFGEWGRFETDPSSSSSHSRLKSHSLGPEETWNWFTTPSLARRIASLLRPEPTLARKTVQAAVETPKSPVSPSSGSKKSGSGSFFRRSSKSDAQAQTPPPVERTLTPVRGGAMLEEDKVGMTVRTEEVTFRRENEFGVWESLTGWGVVVCLKVGRL